MNLSKMMILSTLLLSTVLNAQDHIGWGDPRDPRDPRNPNRPQEPQRPQRPSEPQRPNDPWEDHEDDQRNDRDVELFIGQYFQGQSSLNLLRDSYTKMQLEGRRIKEIKITASTEQGQGTAKILANGQSFEAARTIPRQLIEHTFRADPFSNQVGRDLRTLELEMKGRFYVEKVVFILLENNGPVGPGPVFPPGQKVEVIRQQLNENIQGEGGLHLFRMFNLGLERQGETVKRVTILARSQRGQAQAQLLLNDQSTGLGQLIGTNSTRVTFDLQPGLRIGREIQSMRLYFRGNVTIEEVTIEVEKESHGGQWPNPGQNERRLEQVLNQRIFETSGVRLIDLMRIERRHEERIVDSVELVLKYADYGARVKLCQEVSSQYQAVNCGTISTLNPGAQVIRLSSVNFAKLKEVSLSVRMGMIDIERIIVNLR